MAYLGTWQIDDVLTFYANTTRFDTGAATDADAVPAYRVYEDETGTAILNGNMALLDSANTAGFYSEQITLSAANGFEVGKQYVIYKAATVNSVAGASCDTFQVESAVATAAALTTAQNDLNTITGADGVIIASGTQTFNMTGSITGNLSGSVGSVTGAVGSVTGNVGGNVTGSVGSVVGAVGSVTGAVGSVTGAVGSVTGNVGGNVAGSVGSVTGAVGSVTGNVGGSVASVVAAVAITSNIKQNQALAGFQFLMTDSTNHAPAAGLTVTVSRSIDGGAFAAGTLSAVSEVSDGVYAVDFGAGDLNGKVIILQATAAASDTTFERIVTQV